MKKKNQADSVHAVCAPHWYEDMKEIRKSPPWDGRVIEVNLCLIFIL